MGSFALTTLDHVDLIPSLMNIAQVDQDRVQREALISLAYFLES